MARITLVVAVDWLFASSGSKVSLVTVALFVSCPTWAGTVTFISQVTLSPLASVPAVQVTIPLSSLQPLLADPNVTPPGRASSTIMLVAVSGPWFTTTSV